MEDGRMKYEPLATFVRFPSMRAHATVQASKKAGGDRFELDGSGMMVFAIRNTTNPKEMAVAVRDLRIDFEPTKIDVPKLGTVNIPRFTVTECDLDLDRTQGTWYRSKRAVKLELAIRLDPDRFPIMRGLGFTEPVTVVAVESGRLDWERGRRMETHAEPFTLPPPLDFLTVSAGQFDVCPIEADLRVATDCAKAEELRATEIWICPGDEVCLVWEVSGNPTSVTLDPGGAVSASDSKMVHPNSTTTYSVTGKDGDCDDRAQVTVRVVREGESIFNMSADWNPWENCVWRVEIPAALVGKSVMAVEMRHVKCDGGVGTWPEWGYHHTEPGGNIFSGNIVVDDWRDITDQPLAGTWRFSPVGISNCRPPTDSSGWEPACFEIRLGCRQ
jgi:hypothetical protein